MGLQFIKSNYFYRQKDGFDKVLLITKNEKMEKDFIVVEKPVLEYYISNEDVEFKEYRSIPENMVKKYKCYYKDLYSSMVTNLGDQNLINYYNGVMNSGNKTGMNKALQKLHLDYRFHSTDINIENYYIAKFLDKHDPKENNFKLTKFFYDIEVDTTGITGFPEPEESLCPVNIISSCMEVDGIIQCNMFCLYYSEEENKSYFEFFQNLRDNVLPIKEELEKKYGKEVKINIKRFRNELNLIKAFFDTINELKPDFVLGFNSADFDFPYLYNRLGVLLVNDNNTTIEDIMCPKEFPYKSVKYRIDYNSKSNPADSKSVSNVASYSIHMDVQKLYANLRKAKGKLDNYDLNTIAQLELNEKKEDLTTNIKTQHLDDYLNFFKYSIKDTLLLYELEEKNHDIEMLNAITTLTRTRPETCLTKTESIRNLADAFYRKNGKIISNNRSSLKTKDGTPRGALTYKCTLNSFNCWKILA